MIFYGWRKKTVFLSNMDMQSCRRCNVPGSLKLFLNYTSVHLYWVFGVVTNRKYIAQCSACRVGDIIPKSDVAVLVSNSPVAVPFMERWGLAVFLGLLALVIAVIAAAR